MHFDEKGLPDFCFAVMPSTQEVLIVRRGEKGYYPYFNGVYKGKAKANELNFSIGVNPAQAEAMRSGSIFGFHCPGADPAGYEEHSGQPYLDEEHVIRALKIKGYDFGEGDEFNKDFFASMCSEFYQYYEDRKRWVPIVSEEDDI